MMELEDMPGMSPIFKISRNMLQKRDHPKFVLVTCFEDVEEAVKVVDEVSEETDGCVESIEKEVKKELQQDI